MGSVVMVINIMISYSRAKASASRINEVFETESSIKDKEDANIIENFDIEFKMYHLDTMNIVKMY